MANGDVETYYQDGQWRSRVEGKPEPFSSGGTQSEQVARGAGRAWARRVQHVIRDENGQIARRQSYRDDEPDR